MGYQRFYNVAFDAATTDAVWSKIHDDNSAINALGAYRDDTLIGIAHFVYLESTWNLRHKCYLQDLYVEPEGRRLGVGGALLEAVRDTARRRGAYQLTWLTHEDNTTARALYDKYAKFEGYVEYSVDL